MKQGILTIIGAIGAFIANLFRRVGCRVDNISNFYGG